MTAEEQNSALTKPLKKFTSNTITDLENLNEILKEVRRTGLSFDNQEIEIGLSCLAAPILDIRDLAVAAISISGPTSRLTQKRIAELSPVLLETVSAISSHLGRIQPEGGND